jgi:hypothetical protein
MSQELTPVGSDDSLGGVFDLPEHLDVRSRMMFSVITGRMRGEARLMPMATGQMLLMERMVTNYVIMRELEAERDVHNIPLMRYHAEQWLKCTVEFNKMVSRTQSSQQREAYMERVTQVIMGSLEELEDIAERRKIATMFMKAVEMAGL